MKCYYLLILAYNWKKSAIFIWHWGMKVEETIRIWDPVSLYTKSWILKVYAKYSAWGVQLQSWNLTELAGISINGGTCGLMR